MTLLHGMSSKKASRVKTRGHSKENLYVQLIGGTIVKGTKKEDIKDKFGKFHSIKGGSEMKGGDGIKGKWQLFLYKKSRFESDASFCGKDIFIKILNLYPEKHEEYITKKSIIKENIKPYILELKTFLIDEKNKRKFIEQSIFSERVDYFVIYHNEIFRIFDKCEIIDILSNTLVVDINRTSQKVVFKHKGNLVAEIEIRTTNDGKYPSILFNMLKHKICSILNYNNLKCEIITPNIYAYGKSIPYMIEMKKMNGVNHQVQYWARAKLQ